MSKCRKSLLVALTAVSVLGLSAVMTGKTELAANQVLQSGDYIVVSNAKPNGTLSDVKALQALVSKTIQRPVSLTRAYTDIFVGGALHLSGEEAEALKGVPGITLYRSNVYALPQVDKASETVTDPASLKYANFSQETLSIDYSKVSNKGAGIKIGIMDTGLYYDQVASSADANTYQAFRPLAGDALTATSLTQEQVTKIAPTLNAGKTGKYVNSKIVFEYDYGDGDNNVQPTEGNEHGTHVASLAGGNGAQYQGVAPNAQLAIMKVFSSQGGAATQDVLAAFDDAAKLGLDVISLSLGTPLFDYPTLESGAEAAAVKSLRDKGIVVNFAAGNSGVDQFSQIHANYFSTDAVETGNIGYYALLDDVNVVASATQDRTKSYFLKVNGNADPVLFSDVNTGVTLSSVLPLGESSEYAYVDGVGTPSDFAKADVAGKIAVVNRGSITFQDKADNATHAGAKALIVINSDDSFIGLQWNMVPTIPVAMVYHSAQSAFASSPKGTLTYDSAILANPLADTMSDFSGDGSDSNLSIKPDITAPGDEILGATKGGYKLESGTSMATPNFSGVSALILGQSNQDESAIRESAKSLMPKIESTADPVRDAAKEPNDSLNYASVKKQGAGMANVTEAVTTKVYLESLSSDGKTGNGHAKLEFKTDSAFQKGDVAVSFLAHNGTGSNQTYKASLYVAGPGLGQAFDADSYQSLSAADKTLLPKSIADRPLQTTENHYLGTYDYGNVVIPADQDGKANIVNLPEIADLNAALNGALADYGKNFPEGYSLNGYLILTPTDASQTPLNMPFLGFYGDYGKALAVEPFDFERNASLEDEAVTDSDLVNYWARQYTYQNPYSDYGSHIYGVGEVGGQQVVKSYLEANWQAQGSLESYGFTKLGYTTGFGDWDTGVDGLVAGQPGVSDNLVITQFLERNLTGGTVSLQKDGKTLQTVSLFGSSINAGLGALTRSRMSDSGLTNGFFVSMAGAYMPLSDWRGNAYADGTYNLHFEYTLLAQKDDGSNYAPQTKDVPLTIQRDSHPQVEGIQASYLGKTLTVSADVVYAVINNMTLAPVGEGEKKTIDLSQIPSANGFYSVTLQSRNGNRVDLLLDSRANGANALTGSGLSNVSYFEILSSSDAKKTTYTVNAWDAKGREADDYFAKSHGFNIYVGTGKSIASVSGKSVGSRTQDIVDYRYDPSTGILEVTNLIPGISIIDVAFKA